MEELVKEYVRHNADAVTEIQELLADACLSLEALTADELADRPEYLDYIERIDRLASIAESRRNASLREIDRRRAVLGGALQRGVQDVEDAEFKVIERRRLKGKDAAFSPRFEPTRPFRSSLVRRGAGSRARNCRDKRQCRYP